VNLWRLHKKKYEDTLLQGIGSASYPGRWNKHGEHVVYLANSPALALLEILVHLEVDLEDMPEYSLAEIHIKDPVYSMSSTDTEFSGMTDEQEIGSYWYREEFSLLLKVPSVIVPFPSMNWVLNAAHPLVTHSVSFDLHEFEIDDRLIKP